MQPAYNREIRSLDQADSMVSDCLLNYAIQHCIPEKTALPKPDKAAI